MSAPDSDNKTKLTNPPMTQTRMVRAKAVHAIRVTRDGQERVISPGQETELTEDEAKEFCDRPFDIGYKNAFGNMDRSMAHKTVIHRAERIK